MARIASLSCAAVRASLRVFTTNGLRTSWKQQSDATAAVTYFDSSFAVLDMSLDAISATITFDVSDPSMIAIDQGLDAQLVQAGPPSTYFDNMVHMGASAEQEEIPEFDELTLIEEHGAGHAGSE